MTFLFFHSFHGSHLFVHVLHTLLGDHSVLCPLLGFQLLDGCSLSRNGGLMLPDLLTLLAVCLLEEVDIEEEVLELSFLTCNRHGLQEPKYPSHE